MTSQAEWGVASTGRVTQAILAGSIAVCLGLQLVSIFTREINWDEFFYLSHVYSFGTGTLSRALQTVHVFLFFWLPWTGGNEISQIEIGRSFMFMLLLVTCTCIFLMGRRLFGIGPALFAVLAYTALNFVMDHGAAFRADPLAAALAMASLALLLLSSLRAVHIVVAAAMIALAALVTVKTVFYVPAFVAVGLWRLRGKDAMQQNFVRLTVCAALASAFFIAAYFALIAVLPSADHAGSEAMMTSAAENTLGLMTHSGFLRFLRTLVASPFIWLALVAGLAISIGQLRFTEGRDRALLVLGLALPLLSLVIYRNAFAYYYPFILPPAMLLTAYSAEMLSRRKGWLALAAMPIAVPAVHYWVGGLTWRQDVQHEAVQQVHRLFPQPVAYFDRNSMISSFPKRGLFMSTWGLKAYVAKGQPVFAKILQNETVPLLIVNSPSIEAAVGLPVTSQLYYRLLPADEAALRNNYVPYWGPIWLAGKDIALVKGCTDASIAIPGTYTLRSPGQVSINGSMSVPSEKIALKRGIHRICSDQPQRLLLQWATEAAAPDYMPQSGPVYKGFR